MKPRFESAVALITGAGSGIGRAVAQGFLKEGGRAVLLGRTRSKLASLAEKFPADRTLLIEGAHEDASIATQAIEGCIEQFGQLDFLFNNAGVYAQGTVAEMSDAEWRHLLDANLTGPFYMTRAALPALRKSSRAVIVNNASTLGLKPVPSTAGYSIAKAGLLMLTQATAIEEAAAGVRVNAICPGVVDTPIHAEGGEELLQEMAALHPLGRVGTTEDVAALVLFLASTESAWTTGAVIPIDGGISLA